MRHGKNFVIFSFVKVSFFLRERLLFNWKKLVKFVFIFGISSRKKQAILSKINWTWPRPSSAIHLLLTEAFTPPLWPVVELRIRLLSWKFYPITFWMNLTEDPNVKSAPNPGSSIAILVTFLFLNSRLWFPISRWLSCAFENMCINNTNNLFVSTAPLSNWHHQTPTGKWWEKYSHSCSSGGSWSRPNLYLSTLSRLRPWWGNRTRLNNLACLEYLRTIAAVCVCDLLGAKKVPH